MRGHGLGLVLIVVAACGLLLGPGSQPARAIAPAAVCAGPQVVACAAVGRAAAGVATRGAARVGRAIIGRVRGRGTPRPARSGRQRAGRAAVGVGAAAGLVGFEAFTGGISEGAGWLIRQAIGALDASARVDLQSAWFAEHYELMGALAAFLLLPLLLVSLIMSLLRGDWPGMVRASLLYVPASIFLTAVVVTITQTALAAVDAFSAGLAEDVAVRSGDLAASAAALGLVGGVPAFVALLVGLVMSLAALAVWLELVLRAAAIYVAVAFAPLFFAGIVWPRLQGWAAELARLLVALVLSKLVIVSVLSLGLAGVTELEGVSGVVSGAAIFALAAFAPFALLSLLPLAAGIGAGVGAQARTGIGEAGGLRRVWHNAQRRLGPPLGEMQPATAGAAGGAAGAALGSRFGVGANGAPSGSRGRKASAAGTASAGGAGRSDGDGGASAPHATMDPLPAREREGAPQPGGEPAPGSRVSESTAARIVRASRAGSSSTQIARDLDAAGVAPPRGERWSPSTVRGVIARQDEQVGEDPGAAGGPLPEAGRRIDPQRPPGQSP